MTLQILTSDIPGLGAIVGPPQWGLFNQDGSPVLTVESTAAIQYSRDYDISDYPQEQGAFFTYNKVQKPFEGKISVLSNRTRFQLMQQLEPAAASLNLVVLVTPEIPYQNCNIKHYDFRRGPRTNVTLVWVDIWVEEIQQLSSGNLSPTQSTNGATPSPSGQVQPITSPTAAAASGAGNLFEPAPSNTLPPLPVPQIDMPASQIQANAP